MRLILVRHGEPDYRSDCLTPNGQVQAEQVSELLCGMEITRIASSPLGRARETAAYTAGRLGLPVAILDFMREIDWFPLEGSGEDPADQRVFHPWHCAQRLAREGKDLFRTDPERQEFWYKSTLKEDHARVLTGADRWLETLGYRRDGIGYRCQSENSDTIALFAHHGSGLCLISRLTGIPLLYLFGLTAYDYTGITVLRLDGKPGEYTVPVLEAMNVRRG